MKKDKVTVQDIADALGFSRNTVSKALNGQYVPPKTRNLVLNTAIEMGYKSYNSIASSSDSFRTHKRIALVTSRYLMNINYYIYVMRGIESALEDKDIELLQFTVTSAATFRKLTDFMEESKIDGVLCIELFQHNYLDELISLGYPLVSLDFPSLAPPVMGKFDLILPESFRCIRTYCLQLIAEKECKTFGFVGDYLHCRSFYDRFLGMREALFVSDIPFDPQYSITVSENDLAYANPYALYEILSDRKALPQCFVCANDSIALALIEALKKLRKRVPKDCLVFGFDNVPEAKSNEPALTTFSVDKVALGKRLLSMLLERIDFPQNKSQTVYIESRLIVRQTT
ncbi:MAG: LacI family DNA-binding transcriptional regulator [Lachnospiraceae bacterium]|nr:LacI family DNA-binding transcriptional regulator [Lachnospiraceae bacterium]